MKYRDRLIGEFRLDLLVENTVVLELKCVGRMEPIFEAQLLTYLRISGMSKGLPINFNSPLLRDGIKRLVL
jgi:GxxExxY protein